MPARCLICESGSPKWIDDITIDVPHRGALIKNIYLGVSHRDPGANICIREKTSIVGVGRVIEVPTGDGGELVNSIVFYHRASIDEQSICSFSGAETGILRSLKSDLFRKPESILAIELSIGLKIARETIQNALVIGSGIEALASIYYLNKRGLNAYVAEKRFRGVRASLLSPESTSTMRNIDTIYLSGVPSQMERDIIDGTIAVRDRVKIFWHPSIADVSVTIRLPRRAIVGVVNYPYTIDGRVVRHLKGFINVARLNGVSTVRVGDPPPEGYLYLIIDFSH